MKCPNCLDSTLVMADRQNVEIDYCPTCRGIWLDRGELDKLLEKAAAAAPVATSVPVARERPRHDHDDGDYRRGRSHYRKKSWLHEIFD